MTVAKIWNGSSWVTPSGFNIPRIWDGSSWIPVEPLEASGPSVTSTTLVVGTASYSATKFAPARTVYGYRDFGPVGSIANNKAGTPWQDAVTTDLYWQTDGILPSGAAVVYSITGSTRKLEDMGFTSITINGTTFTRASSSFQSLTPVDPPYTVTWYWSTASNPFPAAGSTTTINWT